MTICFWVLVATNVLFAVLAINGTRLADNAHKAAEKAQKLTEESMVQCTKLVGLNLELYKQVEELKIENTMLQSQVQALSYKLGQQEKKQ